MLKEIRIPMMVNVPVHLNDLAFDNLNCLMRLITFFMLIILHTVSKIGMYGLLYILTHSL